MQTSIRQERWSSEVGKYRNMEFKQQKFIYLKTKKKLKMVKIYLVNKKITHKKTKKMNKGTS